MHVREYEIWCVKFGNFIKRLYNWQRFSTNFHLSNSFNFARFNDQRPLSALSGRKRFSPLIFPISLSDSKYVPVSPFDGAFDIYKCTRLRCLSCANFECERAPHFPYYGVIKKVRQDVWRIRENPVGKSVSRPYTRAWIYAPHISQFISRNGCRMKSMRGFRYSARLNVIVGKPSACWLENTGYNRILEMHVLPYKLPRNC